MNIKHGRALPGALMALGAAMALFALVMLSLQGGALQYCALAPQPGDNGQAIEQLVKSAAKLGENLKDALKWTAVGGDCPGVSVSAGRVELTADARAIGEGWLEVYPRFLVRGRLVTEAELSRGDRVVMLDEPLAFRLFGDALPEDARVTLNEVSWQVVGTVRHAGSLLGGRGVGDSAEYDVYLPLTAAAKAGIGLETLTLSALPQGGAGAAQLFEEAAQSEWLAGGQLINLDKEAMRRTILPRMVLLVAGLYALAALFRKMTDLASGWFEGFRAALAERYFRQLIPKLIGILALSLLGYAVLIGLTWLLMEFSARPLYVFTEWVPENISKWSSIAQVFWNLTGQAAGHIRLGTRELRIIEFWGGILRWGMISLLLGGTLRGRKRVES